GITTPMIVEFETGKDSLDGLQVNDAISETQKAIDELKDQVDAIVAVIHMGEENENNIAGTGVIDVANACPDIDVIIAGHMHLNVSSNIVNNVLITEPDKYGRAVSDVKLSFTANGGGYELTDKTSQTLDVSAYASDPDLEAALAEYHDTLRAMVNEPIGTLVGENLVEPDEIKGISRVYTEPTGIMNLFLDVAKFYSGADVVALCTDNENAQLETGDICIKDIAKNYTYTAGEVTVYEITGADLKAYMEWSADYFNTLQEGDLTISYNPERRNSKYSTDDIFGGINFQIDLTEESGNRIKNMVLADGTEVKDDTKLTLGMNFYRMGQLQEDGGIFAGKGFKVIYNSIATFGEEQGTIRNLTVKYIKEECNGELTGNFTKNWEIIGLDKDSEDYKLAKEYINDGTLTLPASEDGAYTNVKSITVDDVKNVK
ncbi:MAG: bifunctional metallophosphatase/5'-nucleotidase, partial [Clostridia bacterium]|nr:bifunctional metallophosphatase/5'-nucleotidase [Clostridia bacterium]